MDLKLKRNGFVYNMAYAWRHAYKQPPKETTLCKLFWRCMFSIAFIWPCVFIGFIAGILFGYRPALWREDCWRGSQLLVPYKSWPSFTKEKIRVIPAFVIILMTVALAITYLLCLFVHNTPHMVLWCEAMLVWLWRSHILMSAMSGASLFLLVGYGLIQFQKTETCDNRDGWEESCTGNKKR